jgi:hypothetical protein
MNKRWFKRKKYGYGWTPVSKEGWLLTLGLVIAVIAESVGIGLWLGDSLIALVTILVVVGVTLVIFYRLMKDHAEMPPVWQWGDDAEKTDSEKL